MIVIVQDRQNLYDLAVQHFGTAMAVDAIAKANNMSQTEELEAGVELIIPTTALFQNKEIINYYNKHSIVATTANTPNDIPTKDGVGIGFMQIETTFKVS